MLEVNVPYRSVPTILVYNENDVVYAGEEPVTIGSNLETYSYETILFITLDPSTRRVTFSEFYNKDFLDWSYGYLS